MVKFSIREEEDGKNRRKYKRTSSQACGSGNIRHTRACRSRNDPDNHLVDEDPHDEICSGDEKGDVQFRSQVGGIDEDGSIKAGDGGPLNLTLGDPSALDCPICFECLTVPVYQCKNGHAACASCFPKHVQKCPSCSLPIEYNRCRAIENVLESLRIPCLNKARGCKELILYCKKDDHLSTCPFAECSCPVLGCDFSGSSKQVYHHAKKNHYGPFVRFKFDFEIIVNVTSSDKVLILQEEGKGALFILKNECEGPGNIITLVRLGPSSSKERNYYDLSVKAEQCTIILRSSTKIVKSRHDYPGGTFLMVPSDIVCSAGHICINLTIWGDGKAPPAR